MKSLASAEASASQSQIREESRATDDGLLALVRWRLADPAWGPSFGDLLEDVRTCVDPAASAATVLAALRDAVAGDTALAPRAGILAVQARKVMAARKAPPRPLLAARKALTGRAAAALGFTLARG